MTPERARKATAGILLLCKLLARLRLNVKAWLGFLSVLCFVFCVSCLSFCSFVVNAVVVAVAFCFFVWTHFIVGHGTFLRHSFIIWNVVGYRQATLVMLAWLPGCSTGPSPLSGSPTLPCVLLAIMPKIWLTSRLLLFIMIHFARFYGCPVPNAVAQWSLQVNEAFNFYSRSTEG